MPMDKWDPFQDFLKLRNIFNELFERSLRQHNLGEDMGPSYWTPCADIYDNADEIVIQLEIPGVSRENIDIEVSGNQLTVKGDRQPTYGKGQAEYHRIERRHGPYKRVIDMPVSVDTNNIKASYQAGVLTVVLPAGSGTQARKIPINVKAP